MANKKSQGLSLTTIIIAAIALVVLVVLIMIFTGKIRGFGEGMESCEQKGAVCEYPQAGTKKCPQVDGEDVYATIAGECADESQVCCLKIL